MEYNTICLVNNPIPKDSRPPGLYLFRYSKVVHMILPSLGALPIAQVIHLNEITPGLVEIKFCSCKQHSQSNMSHCSRFRNRKFKSVHQGTLGTLGYINL